ncbi:unnamed protein product [Echinostoma caproni]|uniref:Swiss cheese n=1 Tax=Echinostoma caproni TaxID=27848 RepID=A0A183A8F6_9TREM|nr:unnamed protein product [Echinostoma caproni]
MNATTLDRYRLPESFFEPDEEEDSTFPDDLKLMISSIRVFGHLEKSLFIDFCKFIEAVHLEKDEFLFRIGDPDEYLYVVNSGKIQLYIIENETSKRIASKSQQVFAELIAEKTTEPPNVTENITNFSDLFVRLDGCKTSVSGLAFVIIFGPERFGWPSNIAMLVLIAAENVSPSFEPEPHLGDDHTDDLSPIINEFQHDFDPNVRRASGGGICLELGEAPSRARKEKSVLISRPTTPTKDLEAQYNPKSLRETTVPVGETLSSGCSRPASRWWNLGKEADAKLMEAVQEDISHLLNLPGPQMLKDHLILTSVPSGTTLTEECEMPKEIYFIISGEIHAVQSISSFGPSESSTLLVCYPGELVGLLGLITGETNVFSLQTTDNSVLAIMSRDSFFALVRQHPETLFSAIRLLASRISPLLHQLDFAIQWITIDAGKALYKRGDPANHVFVVLSGRLRQVDSQSDGARRIAGELSRGDLVGFLEVVCSQSRVHTVLAIRDSEVAQIPSLLLFYLKEKVPQVLTRVVKLLSDRLLGNLTSQNQMNDPLGLSALGARTRRGLSSEVFSASSESEDITANNNFAKITMSNLRTIAILPATSAINAEAFTLELQHSMTPIGSSVRLTSRIIRKRLGPTALDSVNQYRLNAWLGLQEDLHRMVFFVCNSSRSSAWNRLCIRQADCVLVLALGNSDPSRPSPIEMTLKNHPTKVAKALVLMYPLDTDYPISRQTAKWLNVRPWISHHYHIRCEPRVFTPRSPDDLLSFYSNVFAREKPNPLSDFSRLARYLTGEAIALVLGGGGARGCAHAGVIRAFQDAGVPIDLIGGTSMGAFMSALWAEETRFAQFTQRAKKFTDSLNSIWNRVKDFTYPAVSIFSGKEFNAQLEKVFGERQVEDLWIPSFYITTDITNCKMRVHTQGSLWRYVRASMSLSGYMPPLCDPYDGSLLLDGGYTNNVPADVMSSFGAKTIFAVDVGASVDTDFTNYGDHLSGWSLLYHRFFGSSSSVVRVPNLTEIQSRLAYISCVRQLEKVKKSGICHYMRPPIDHYMTLQFSAFDEILNVGYDYAKRLLLSWHEDDKLRHLVPGLRPGPLFEQPHPKAHIFQTYSRPHSVDGSVTPSALLTQDFGGQRTFIDLAETFSSLEAERKLRICTSDTDDECAEPHGSLNSGTQIRPTDNMDLFNSLMGRPWRKRPGVRSLSEAVYSYLNSASRIVSRNLPDGETFRRRALSASLNVSLAESSSSHDSSEEAGHYSDALDHPSADSHLPVLAEFLHRKQSAEAEQTNHSNQTESNAVHESPPDMSHLFPPRSLISSMHDNDEGYLEDNESDAEHPLSRLTLGVMDSDPELSHEVLNEVVDRRTSPSFMNRLRSSSLVRLPSDHRLGLQTDRVLPSDHGLSENGNRKTEIVVPSSRLILASDSHNGSVRKRRRHHRSSLNRLHRKNQPSPPASGNL